MRRLALRAHGVFSDSPLVCKHGLTLSVVILAAFGFALVGPAVRKAWGQAQAFSASLSGFVYDNSGAVVPAATVTLSSPEKGFTQTIDTQPDGAYMFTLLRPGTYALKVEKSGFQTYIQSGIMLTVGQAATQDVSLQVGAVSQEVSVTAGAEILNTETANVGTTVSQQQVLDLPLDTRNVFVLVGLNASVNNSSQYQIVNGPGQQDTADQDFYFLNFGGGRFGTTGVLLDGDWDVGPDWGGYMYVPSVDDTQEFAVQTESFSAQYGYSTGNVINAVTKSGTRDFHGDVWEFLRNSDLDANNFFNNALGVPRPQFRRNQFGFTAGGPLDIPKLYRQRDKTFIFGDLEFLRQTAPTTFTTTLPTAAMRTGDFSALLGSQIGTDALGRPILAGQIYNPLSTRLLTNAGVDPVSGLRVACPGAAATCYYRDPIAGNVIPSGTINSVSKNFLQYWPSPTTNSLINNYIYSAGTISNWPWEFSVRGDHNISDKSRLFFRWSQKHEFKQIGADVYGTNDPGGGGGRALDNRYDTAFGYTRTFNPTLVMSVNLGLARWTEGNAMQAYPFTPSTLGLPSFLDSVSNEFPNIGVDGINGLGPGSVSGGAGQGLFPRGVGSYSAGVTKTLGPHTMNMGFMGIVSENTGGRLPVIGFHFPQSMTEGPDPTTASPSTSGYGFASFLLGTGDNGGANGSYNGTELTQFTVNMKKMYGLYFQDDWKTTRKLTLNLGLRWDYQPGPTERYNRQQWFDFSAANPISQKVGFTVPGEIVFAGAGNGRDAFIAPKTNFAPRIGLAYQATNKLVVRSGFGLFDLQTYQCCPSSDGYTASTPYVGTVNGITPVNLISNPFPTGLVEPTQNSLGALQDVGLSVGSALQHTRPSPYMEQWMFGLEYALTPNDLIDVTYLGNRGVKLPFGSTQADQLPPQDLTLGSAALTALVPNPFYGVITSSGCGLNGATVPAFRLLLPYPEYCSVSNSQPPGSFSNYNAAEITFKHRLAEGLQLGVSYTISKFIDNDGGENTWANAGSSADRNAYDLAAEKSLDGDDIPQSLVVNYVYQLPVGHGQRFGSDFHGVEDAILGGWQFSGITTAKSGFPLSITTSTNNLGAYNAYQRPELVGDPHVSNPTISEWFNVNAFAQPAGLTFGDVPRYMPNLRAPGLYDWDLALEKWWHPLERLRIQFRSEFFNAFNRVNFFAPNQTFGSPGFGTITAAERARDIQFGLKLYW
jgi:Carboxypeptidase regulatory-like domain/TonB dependent receptor